MAPESTLDALTGGASLVGIGAAAASSSGGVGGVTAAAEGSDEEESGSSEYETDTEDDETDNFKPVFVRWVCEMPAPPMMHAPLPIESPTQLLGTRGLWVQEGRPCVR